MNYWFHINNSAVSWLMVGETVCLLTILFYCWIKYRRAGKEIKPNLIITPFIINLVFFGLSSAYTVWKLNQDPVQRFLLPPHSSWLWEYLGRGGANMLAGWCFTLGFGLVLWWLFIRATGRRLADQRDVILIVLGMAVIGWPGMLLFWGMIFIISILAMIYLVVTKKKSAQDRLLITPYIIPAAILTLIFKIPLLEITHLVKIRF
jgi:hypothetical protein